MTRILIEKNSEQKVVEDSEYWKTYQKQGWKIATKTTPLLTTAQVTREKPTIEDIINSMKVRSPTREESLAIDHYAEEEIKKLKLDPSKNYVIHYKGRPFDYYGWKQFLRDSLAHGWDIREIKPTRIEERSSTKSYQSNPAVDEEPTTYLIRQTKQGTWQLIEKHYNVPRLLARSRTKSGILEKAKFIEIPLDKIKEEKPTEPKKHLDDWTKRQIGYLKFSDELEVIDKYLKSGEYDEESERWLKTRRERVEKAMKSVEGKPSPKKGYKPRPKPIIQSTLTGEAALLAQRVKKTEPVFKKKAKKTYKEPEPYQEQLGGGHQTTLLVLGGIGAFIALLKLSKSKWHQIQNV